MTVAAALTFVNCAGSYAATRSELTKLAKAAVLTILGQALSSKPDLSARALARSHPELIGAALSLLDASDARL
jgi:hypothetical protein